jgi:hypothetical protein
MKNGNPFHDIPRGYINPAPRDSAPRWIDDPYDGYSEGEDPRLLPGLTVNEYFKVQDITLPSIHKFARARAKDFTSRHIGADEDPDDLLIVTLYIHRDRRPRKANVAYAMTLTDAMIRNWQQTGNGEYFASLGHLAPHRPEGYELDVVDETLPLYECIAYEAIYRKTSPQRYDRSTQLDVPAADYKGFVWSENLGARYTQALATFWERHRDGYNFLIKGSLVKAACIQYDEGTLALADKSLVLRSIGVDPEQAWETMTFRQFADGPLSDEVTFHELVLHRYTATDIMIIKDQATGRVVLYIPGNSSPLYGFDSQDSMADWIAAICKDPRKRSVLESHFSIYDDSDGWTFSGVRTTLAGLAAYPAMLDFGTGFWVPRYIVKLGPAIAPWPFSHFRDNLEARLKSDAYYGIGTRSEYWKEAAAKYVTNAMIVTGAIALVAPEVVPLVIAMAGALTAIGTDQAINGRDQSTRETGLGRVEFGILNALPVIAEGVDAAIDTVRGVEASNGGAVDELGHAITVRNKAVRDAFEGDADALDAHHEMTKVPVEQGHSTEQRLDSVVEKGGLRGIERIKDRAPRAIDVLEKAYGVEPPGLRSLSTPLRAKLKRLEFTEDLQGGTWISDGSRKIYQVVDEVTGETRDYIRLHAKVYRVQWSEPALRYQIVSPSADGVTGPYIREISLQRWDIDVQSGLRGGEAPSVLKPPTESTEAKVLLTRAQPPIHIDLPMNQIYGNVPHGPDGVVHRFVAQTYPNGEVVYFDADIGSWRTGPVENDLIWWINRENWGRGNLEAFKKFKPAYSRETEVFTFPRIPGLPKNPEAIDKMVHHIWMGDRLPGTPLLDNIKRNMGASPELKFTLHVDIDDADAVAKLEQVFADYPNMRISSLPDEDFYNGFRDREKNSGFDYFRNGPNKNLAAASDILRYRLLHEYGGIYMDCDDRILGSFDSQLLPAGPHDVLTGGVLDAETLGYKGPGNSHFASHAGNPVLLEMGREIDYRLANEKAFLAQPRPFAGGATDEAEAQIAREKMNHYMKKISELTGPKLFSDVLQKMRPDYYPLLNDSFVQLNPDVVSRLYLERVDEARNFYAPFRSRMRILAGTDNSWLRPAIP